MRWTAFPAALLLLSGCFLFSSGPRSRTGDTPEDLQKTRPVIPPTWDVFPYGDPARLQPGEWARYRVTEKGASHEITMGVGARNAAGLWIEVVEEFETRRASAQLVAADGAVSKAYYREIPRQGSAGPAYEQERKQYVPPSDPTLSERSRTTDRRDLAVGNRTLPVVEVKVAFEDMSGRRMEEEWIWSAGVPQLFAGGELGGLVRKKTAAQSVELLDFGTGYKLVVDIPR